MNKSKDPGSHSQRLLIVPTAMEREKLQNVFRQRLPNHPWSQTREAIGLCGFGMAAAAAMTMHHLHRHATEHVILAGIAGSLSQACQVGSAYWFSKVVCDGIGVGDGDSFESAAAMGWKQVEIDRPSDATLGSLPGRDSVGDVTRQSVGEVAGKGIGKRTTDSIGDVLQLHVPGSWAGDPSWALVTACAGAADFAMAARRSRRMSDLLTRFDENAASHVAAEDMEGFGVAIACRIMNVRLSIVRGISNRAGDRNHAGWRIDDAINAVADQLACPDQDAGFGTRS